MKRTRSVGKTIALGCGGLIVLLIVLAIAGYTTIRVVAARRAQTALARLKASGGPTTWQEVIPAPVPDDQNAALLYEEGFAVLALSDPSHRAITDYLLAEGRDERRALEKEVRRIVSGNAKALAYARQAATRPECRFDRDWSDPVAMNMPELVNLKNLSGLACAQALLRSDRGDGAGALEAWSLNLSIASHLESDPMFLAQLRGYAVIGYADQALPRILQSGRPRPEQCRSMAEALGRLDLSEAFVKSCQAERPGDLWLVDRGWEDPNYVAVWAGAPPPKTPRRGLRLGPFGFIRQLDQAAMIEYWERQMALARQPYRQSAGQFDAVRDKIPRYAIMTRVFASEMARATASRDKAVAKVALMRTALGLAAYRTQHGRYPESLEELREALKWEVPEDPFSGKDLVYRRDAAGYLLYSIGRDLDDDGGRPIGAPGTRKALWDCDIVWRMER